MPSYRAGATCRAHGIVHSRPKSSERAAMRAKVVAAHGGQCVYCGLSVTGADCEMDRVVDSCIYSPVNLLPACKACNNARNRKGVTLFTIGQRDRIIIALRTLLTLPCRSAYAEHVTTEIRATLAAATEGINTHV